MERITPRTEEFGAGFAPCGGRGVRRKQTVSSRPGPLEPSMCHASGDGPNVNSSSRLNPATSSLVPMLAQSRQDRPSAAIPTQVQHRIDSRITIRQKILNNELGRMNQHVQSQWTQASGELRAEIADMRQNYMESFFNRMKDTTTESERERVRLEAARTRENLFSDMKALIQASCLNFGEWRSGYLEAQLEVSRTALHDDLYFDVLVAVLEDQVNRIRNGFQETASECARAVWEEFGKELELEKELPSAQP